MKKLALFGLAIGISVFVAAGQDAKAPEQKPADMKYVENSFGRLSFLEGSAYLQRASDLGYEEGVINMPISEGDRIGTTEGRAEIYIGKKNYIRLDQNTKIDFLNLPRKGSNQIRIRGWAGNIYLDINSLEKEKGIEVLTSDATFYVLDKGLYRIEVRENKETAILVFSGLIEASGEEGSILVKKEQQLTLSDGRFSGKPSSFFASVDDAFDRFNDGRNSKTNRQFAKRYLSEDLEDFESELNDNGDWVNESPFGNVWVPRGMAADWMPYYYGRWTWLPMAGWSWLPYEPWGWSTYHYGRWHWGLGRGWYWIPMHGWGPGWVNWWWDDYYYGWAPMSYWGYPGIIVDNFYYGRGWHDYRDYPWNSRALTVVRKDQLLARDVRSIALGREALKSVGKMSLNERTPNLRPSSSPRISVEPMGGGNKVILRKGGEGAGTVDPKGTSTPRGRDTPKPQTGTERKEPESGRKIDPKSTGESGKSVEPRKRGESGPPATSTPPPGKERKIRKKIGEGESGAGSMGLNANRGRFDTLGYPSRIPTQDGTLNRNSQPRSSGSVVDRIFRNFQNDRSSAPSRGTSIRGSSSSGSAPRSMPAPRMTSSPSSSRGSSARSSGGSSAGRSGGSVRKK